MEHQMEVNIIQAKTENYLLLTHDKKMTYYEDSCVILV